MTLVQHNILDIKSFSLLILLPYNCESVSSVYVEIGFYLDIKLKLNFLYLAISRVILHFIVEFEAGAGMEIIWMSSFICIHDHMAKTIEDIV